MTREEVIEKAKRQERERLMRLRDDVFDSFQQKNQMLFDHVWRCIELGISIPKIRMVWDKRKNELVMEMWAVDRGGRPG